MRKGYMVFLLFFICILSFQTADGVVAEGQTFIVEMEEGHSEEELQRKLGNLQVTQTYKHVFSGFAVKGDNAAIQRLKDVKGIKDIYPVSSYKVALGESVAFIGGEHLRNMLGVGEQVTGKGVKVGVIDTGIDYHHHDLKKSYAGGYDVVDKDTNPMETQAGEGIPTQHGTHVAGIIAANGRLKGVAPEVELYAYRALGPGGTGTSEQVIAAIDQAVQDEMDIINLSLGNNVNGPDWPTSIALNRAVEKGVIAVTSSGNSGPGIWTVGSPGTAAKAISVGASASNITIPYLRSIRDDFIPIQLLVGSPQWKIKKSYELVYAKKGRVEEFSRAKGKFVLIQRGDLSFTEKAKNAEKAGAKAVLIYNNEEGTFNGQLEDNLSIPVVALKKEVGKQLKAQIKAGPTYLDINMVQISDRLAPFSSRGPVTVDWGIKPDILAPGVSINSTIPNGYSAMDGTSMASPHITGAAALMLQLHPDWTPQQVKAAFMNTAKVLNDENGNPYHVYDQGSGRIQLEEALQTKALIYPSSLSFGFLERTLDRQKKAISITVENLDTIEKTVTFESPPHTKGIQWKLPKSFSLKPLEKKDLQVMIDIQPQFIKKGMEDGWLHIRIGSQKMTMPYLVIVEETSFPKVMGFDLRWEEKVQKYKYELYVAEKADKLSLFLIHPDTLWMVPLVHESLSTEVGRKVGFLKRTDLPVPNGMYYGIAVAEIGDQVVSQEIIVELGDFPSEQQPLMNEVLLE